LNRKRVFIDTWGWVALGHQKDNRNQEIVSLYKDWLRRGAVIYTSDFVLDETVTLLFRREIFEEAIQFMEGIFLAAEGGRITVERVTSNRFASAWNLRKRFNDKPLISFTDLTTMAIMKELKIKEIITDDKHFLQIGMGFGILP
jgi:predicted nucleic acid-binding protein